MSKKKKVISKLKEITPELLAEAIKQNAPHIDFEEFTSLAKMPIMPELGYSSTFNDFQWQAKAVETCNVHYSPLDRELRGTCAAYKKYGHCSHLKSYQEQERETANRLEAEIIRLQRNSSSEFIDSMRMMQERIKRNLNRDVEKPMPQLPAPIVDDTKRKPRKFNF